jgi:hypothetical protein
MSATRQKALSIRENAEWEARLRAGDPLAREKLIEGNGPLVTSLVESYVVQKPNLANSWDDLSQTGHTELTMAVDRLAKMKSPAGNKVLGYLSLAVQRALWRYKDNESTIVVPDRTQRLRRREGRLRAGQKIEAFLTKRGCELKPSIGRLVKDFCDRENVLIFSLSDAPKYAAQSCENSSAISSLWSYVRQNGSVTKGRSSVVLGLIRQAFEELEFGFYPTEVARVDRDAEITSQPTAVDPIAMLELQEEIEACCQNHDDLQFVRHAAMGYSDREIAKLLGCNRRTLNDRRAAIYDRFLLRTGMKRR